MLISFCNQIFLKNDHSVHKIKIFILCPCNYSTITPKNLPVRFNSGNLHLPGILMFRDRHFWNRQYWHWTLLSFVILHFLALRQVYLIFCCLDALIKNFCNDEKTCIKDGCQKYVNFLLFSYKLVQCISLKTTFFKEVFQNLILCNFVKI